MQILMQKFINEFANAENAKGFIIRVSAEQVRAFLKETESGLTFQGFNKLTNCKGRSSGGRYNYDLITLFNLLKQEQNEKNNYRHFPNNRIFTIPYYGSKRRWQEEITLILNFLKENQKVTTFVDTCTGSGIVALIASKLSFSEVIMGDIDYHIINYHKTIKNQESFLKFKEILYKMGDIDVDLFNLCKQTLPRVGKAQRKQFRKINIEDTIKFFIDRYYGYNSQGNFISRKAPYHYLSALEKTHKLYMQIEISQSHYLKTIKSYLYREDAIIYIDPPYLGSVRSQKSSYFTETTDRQHRELLKLLTSDGVKAKILLCGYEHDLYSSYTFRTRQKWTCISFKRTGSIYVEKEAKERIWVNFELQELVEKYKDLFMFI